MTVHLNDCDIGYIRLMYNLLFHSYVAIERKEQAIERKDYDLPPLLPWTALYNEQKIAYWAKFYPKSANKAKTAILHFVYPCSDAMNETKEQACHLLRLSEITKDGDVY